MHTSAYTVLPSDISAQFAFQLTAMQQTQTILYFF